MPMNSSILKKYKRNIDVFIETGTSAGETVQLAIEQGFKKIYSIELDTSVYKRAVEKFKDYAHVKISCGESDIVLASILKDLKEPCLFWLDAHPPTGATPILKELKAIAQHYIKNNIILIDDMRCFGGDLLEKKEDIIKAVSEINPKYKITFEDDIITKADILTATE